MVPHASLYMYYCPISMMTSNCMPLGRLGGGGGGGGYMTWLLLATEPSKVVAYPCHYKIPILSSTGIWPVH